MGRLENVGKIEERRAMVGYKLQIARLPTMKSIGGAEGKKTDKKEESEPAVKIDLSKAKVEPLFEDAVDFDTFSKSDFRVVKVEACEAVPKSKKLLKFTLNDGTDRKTVPF